MFTLIPALISLFSMIQTSLAQQGPTQCYDPTMTSWMLNSEGENPCQVAQEVLRVCNPSFSINWLTGAYSCDNGPTSISAACCCGSPTFALLSACWSCQYNYTMDIVSTTFTSFEKNCASVPTPLTSYDPIIRSQVDQIDIPLWAKIEPMAGKWDLAAAWRNATPATTSIPPLPTSYPIYTSGGLSSSAIVGVIVGSVFGTALMFLITAVVLWRCLGLGQRRRQPDDIRVGENMGYLDGEYVYVRSDNQKELAGEEGLGVSLAQRLNPRRDSRGLRPRAEVDLDASDYEASRAPSDYEDDRMGSTRPLRPYSHHRSRSPSYLDPHSPSYAEPSSPFSPARHASFDGQYKGYHPSSHPDSLHRSSLERPRLFEAAHRPSWERAESQRSRRSQHQANGERSREREYRMSGGRSSRPISGHFSQHRPSGERFSTRGSVDPHYGRASADRYSEYRTSRDRPISGQFKGRPMSGQFDGHRPRSGHFSDYRTSAERKRDHRVSVRSGLRPMSFDSTRRSGDSGGSFSKIDDPQPSRDGGRFSGELVRFSRDGGRRYRESRPASLSEGDEDRRRDEDEYSVDEEPPRRSETTSSDYGRRGYQQHLRKRSQSARTSCDPGHDEIIPIQERGEGAGSSTPRMRDIPASAPMSSVTTTNRDSSVSSPPTKLLSGAQTPMRLTNPSPSAELHSSEGTSYLQPPITRDPGLLARARTLLNAPTSKSGDPSSSGAQSQASTSQVPPSAWQRLPAVLRRISSGSQRTPSSRPRSSANSESHDSDAGTSVYHTAQGHTPSLGGNGTPVTEFGQAANESTIESQRSYRQESDAGVQLIVEHSPESHALAEAEAQDITNPPAYVDRRSSDAASVASHLVPETASHSNSRSNLLPQDHSDTETNLPTGAQLQHNRFSTLTRETDLDSTVSSGVIQTWAAARRPTGFVGLGIVLSDGHGSESRDGHADGAGGVGGVREAGSDQQTSDDGLLGLSLMGVLPSVAPAMDHAERRS
ncbi:hypothetical protein BDV93DRAFT_528804 [Ceratobasidium sp. AG-I]|nr:hypothetical protein BDV93DRAFT_528804 [Ceratobasidium sp. AG-I]